MTSSVDQLSDPDMLQASLDKLDDEPVYRYDPRKTYAAGPIEYYLTVANGYVISLAKHDSVNGTVEYRDSGEWTSEVPLTVPVSGTVHVTERSVGLWDERRGRISVRAFINTNLDVPFDPSA